MKKIIKYTSTLFIITALTSCYASKVVPAGRDTHMIVVRSGFDSGEVAKAKAYEKATKWCESRGLVMVPISETSRDVDFGRRPGTATLTFRAVSPSDREYARPVMGRAPDHHQIIEVRNR